MSCSVWCVGVFRRVQPTLGRTDECHLPENAVDPSCDQDPREGCLLARPGDHCEPQYGYFLYHESSHERLRWVTEVANQSEAATQACGEKRTRQRADRGDESLSRVSRVHRPRLNALWRCSCCRTTAFYAATLRVGNSML